GQTLGMVFSSRSTAAFLSIAPNSESVCLRGSTLLVTIAGFKESFNGWRHFEKCLNREIGAYGHV
ncbi:hypothetical protein BaRGS_00010339, partial [Batillaria attramentaria]